MMEQDIDFILKQFDLTEDYGPCVGVTRLERWHRAHTLKCNPPLAVLVVLQAQELIINPPNVIAILERAQQRLRSVFDKGET
ncbi:DNA polymerase delta, subunit 4-domain-containing protein [Mycena vitilis]|nr:DNA polymerase delta, subunit 4-domain-containing protein [Mycena vitilis]